MSAFTHHSSHDKQYTTEVTVKWYIRTTSPHEPGEVEHEIEKTINRWLDRIPERFQEVADEEIDIITEEE